MRAVATDVLLFPERFDTWVEVPRLDDVVEAVPRRDGIDMLLRSKFNRSSRLFCHVVMVMDVGYAYIMYSLVFWLLKEYQEIIQGDGGMTTKKPPLQKNQWIRAIHRASDD